uniref:C2 domain-containing protein n=1 Tax=Acanthochromis polyacanthus TaxID=80966 RepID=A0A3Q1F3W1_9TELE
LLEPYHLCHDCRIPVETCGKLSFSLRYDYEEQALVVRILKALDLPAKDFTGTSDPYVKIYLLPERKKKFQTRVHRKNLNPMFDETFSFPVVYDELCNRKLHFSVYDFDRFTSHDMIGEVVVDNLFELSDLSREAVVWKDIHAATTVSGRSHQDTAKSSHMWKTLLYKKHCNRKFVLFRERSDQEALY